MFKPTFKTFNPMALLAVVALGLAAARPLFTPRLPHGTDTLFHLYTLTQLDYLMAQGIFYSRWFPYQASGFGLPLFHYYPPLAFYVAQLFNFLGFELLPALRLTLGLTIVGGALGIYLWAQDVLEDEGAALVAAAGYVCGPYMLFNAFFRGGFAEQLALMLLPFVLWAFHRWAMTGQIGYLAESSISYAALILAHSLTAFIFSPLLLGYTIILVKNGARSPAGLKASRNRWLALVAVLGIGLGLSAFFWLPALIESKAIADPLPAAPELDYHRNFISLNILFSLPLTPPVRPTLSIIAVGLALIGIFNLQHLKPAVKQHTLFAAAAAAGCAVMVLPFSRWLWEALPLLRFFQFPHRFLGVAALFVAFLAGVGGRSLLDRIKRLQQLKRWPISPLVAGWVMFIIVIGLLAGPTVELAQVRYYPPLPTLDVAFIMQKERESGQIGALYIANFVPATVKTMPPFDRLARDGPERLDVDSLPVEATLIAATYRPLRYDLTLSSPRPFVARFNTFYFPGWQARLDDQLRPIIPTDPHGLISLAVPAGQHRLVIWFGSTPTRALANILSGGSLILLCLMVAAAWFGKQKNISS